MGLLELLKQLFGKNYLNKIIGTGTNVSKPIKLDKNSPFKLYSDKAFNNPKVDTKFSIVGDVSGATTFTSSDKGIVVSLTAAQTSAIKAGRYVYDIEIRKASTSEVNRVLEGQVEITPRVTLSTES